VGRRECRRHDPRRRRVGLHTGRSPRARGEGPAPARRGAARARALLERAEADDLSRAIQLLLNELGASLAVDGVIGPNTRGAIERRAREAGVVVPRDARLDQLVAMAQVYWAENPVRSDIF
jgi:hypothetical protein